MQLSRLQTIRDIEVWVRFVWTSGQRNLVNKMCQR